VYQSVFSQISYLVAFNDNIFALFSRICPGIAYIHVVLNFSAPFAPMRLCFPNWERSDRVGRAAGQPLIYVLYLHHFFLNGFKTLVVDYLRCPVHFSIVPARNLYLCHSYADHGGSNKDIYNCLKKIHLFTAIAIIKDIVFNSKSYD